jgi:hypothetical protein
VPAVAAAGEELPPDDVLTHSLKNVAVTANDGRVVSADTSTITNTTATGITTATAATKHCSSAITAVKPSNEQGLCRAAVQVV